MKSKTKTLNKISILFFLFLALNVIFTNFAYACELLPSFAESIFQMFAALILWIISPIGICFLLAAKILASWKSSSLKRKIAWFFQYLSFLSLMSIMFILLILYLDSISYRIINAGGDILNLAIRSGFAFAVFMLILMILEKKTYDSKKDRNNKESILERIKKNKKDISEEKNGSFEDLKKHKKYNDDDGKSIKIAGIEIGGIGRKIKSKIKEDIKEIVNEEIDKRL